MKPAIRVENLSKRYRIGTREHPANRNLTEALTAGARWLARRAWRRTPSHDTNDGTFWALKDVSFEVQPGEVVGIIGRNGSGKSTLLKILSRIVEPTAGWAEVRGRMASLLEVGTGFHPELTGRENIYLNGSILGMSKKEIDRKFDEIVAFSEIEQFIDTPVKRYSSGMFVRLAFAVAAHLDAEILVVDEVLAVGDTAFQAKCLGKMGSVAESGRTVLLVSHNLSQINRLATKCMYLKKGRCVSFGETSEQIRNFFGDTFAKYDDCPDSNAHPYRRSSSDGEAIRIQEIIVTDSHGQKRKHFASSEPFKFFIRVDSSITVPKAAMVIFLNSENTGLVATLYNKDHGAGLDIVPGMQTIIVECPNMYLSPGRYTASFHINRTVSEKAFDVIMDFPVFKIAAVDSVDAKRDWPQRPWGCIDPQHVNWSVCLDVKS
jgi:lipopolysaccharide transport system ATP-binding protein